MATLPNAEVRLIRPVNQQTKRQDVARNADAVNDRAGPAQSLVERAMSLQPLFDFTYTELEPNMRINALYRAPRVKLEAHVYNQIFPCKMYNRKHIASQI